MHWILILQRKIGTRLPERVDISWIIIAVLVTILCAPVLLGGKVIFWGVPLLQFYPWRWEAARAVSAGTLPLWNPDMGMGAPLLANAQSALLYPPNVLYLIFPLATAQNILLAAHLVFAGWGMSRLVRALAIGRLGQLVAGVTFALCGYVVARAWFLSINATVAWLPWILLAGERLVREAGFKRAVWLALALAMQWLAGHWQTAWYTGWMLVFWVLVRTVQLPAPVDATRWKQWCAVWGWTMFAGILAVGLTAAQTIPTAEYWLNSQRASGVDPTLATNYSFWPWRLLELVAPGFFGTPARGNFHGFGNYWEDAIYIGILPLALAISAVLARIRRNGITGFPYGICLTGILLAFPLAMGPWLTWLANITRWIPGWNIFQAPTRITIWAEVGLILLAAAGVEQWQRSAAGPSRWAGRWGVAALALFLGGEISSRMAPIPESFGFAVATTGGLLFLGVCLWSAKPWAEAHHLPGWIWPAAVVMVVAGDLLLLDAGLLPAGPADLYAGSNPDATRIVKTLNGGRIYMPEPIRNTQTYSRFFRFDTFSATTDWIQMRALELPNVAVLDGISSANNFDPFTPARYATFLDALEKLPVAEQSRVWRMMNVGGVWQGGDANTAPRLMAVANSLGRAWGVCAAEWEVAPQDSLQAVLAPTFDPAERVILEMGKGGEGGRCASPPAITLPASSDPNRVLVRAEFSEPGFLVLADVNYPGWEANLDGELVPLLQADYLFRAVRVPAGSHDVVFEYRPLSFWAGAAFSATAWLGVLLYFIVSFFRMRIRSRGES